MNVAWLQALPWLPHKVPVYLQLPLAQAMALLELLKAGSALTSFRIRKFSAGFAIWQQPCSCCRSCFQRLWLSAHLAGL